MTLKELLRSMICSIVDDVDNVKVEESTTEKGVSFQIAVAKDDVGKIIGTGGRIASALRTVAKAAGAKQGIRVLINVDKAPLSE